MSQKRIHTILADMLAAYDNGEADEQRKDFIAGWALTIAPPATDKPSDEQEVLVRGNPYDGFMIAGPFPQGFHEDRAIPEETWVMLLENPDA